MEVQIPYVIPLSTQKPKKLTLVPNDPGSRYKTLQLQVQVVGKSKMIKTFLLNILEVAKDMQVPPAYIGTFMGHLIGAQAKFDQKKPERQQAFLTGEHDPKDLSKIMVQFVNEVILCPICGLPEILLFIEGGKSVNGRCRACPFNGPLKITDEKFKRYVINHPPSQSKGGAFGGNETGTKKDTSKKEGKGEKVEDDESTKETEEEPKVAKKEKKEKKSKEDDGIVWFSDTSEDAARKRREEMLPDAVAHLAKNKDVNDLANQIKESLQVSSTADSIQALKVKHSNVDEKTFVEIVFDSLFGKSENLLDDIKSKGNCFSKITSNSSSRLALLSSIEQFLGSNTSQLKNISFVIKELYDKEILEEEDIISWYKLKPTKDETIVYVKEAREKVANLIKWFQEAEEEEDDDEDN